MSETRTRSKKLGGAGVTTLEAKILNLMYEKNITFVRDVHEAMLENGYIPYTSVMACMNNMALKGLLKQNRHGKAYRYTPLFTRKQLLANIARGVNEVLGNYEYCVVVTDPGCVEEAETA